MKVMTILGTRPEIIRLSEVIKKLDRLADHRLVHTGQNYDPRLSQVFFDELGLRAPDVNLGIQAQTLGAQLGRLLEESYAVLAKERPDALVILGDTNSALSCIPAKRLGIPIFHLEAGNRCFDDEVPEEVNRRIVDHTADVNLPYTLHAKTNLLREGLRHDRIVLTGSPMAELFAVHRTSITASKVLGAMGLKPGNYLLASIHREENVDRADRLVQLLAGLSAAGKATDRPVLVSVHPRTRRRLSALPGQVPANLQLCEPWGFFDYVHLQQNAFCNLSDSGTIHEDAALLGVPAVVLRNVTERPEAVDYGNVVVSGTSVEGIERAVRVAVEGTRNQSPPDYARTDFSDRVVRVVLGQADLVRRRSRTPP